MSDTQHPDVKGYITVDLIGEGGNGKVYKVWWEDSGEVQALKLLDEDMMDPELKQRFGREVRILSNLHHPNIIPILSYDIQVEEPWFTMPLASRDLSSDIKAGPLTDDYIRTVFTQVLNAVEYAHGSNVVHRDIKPSNILIMQDGTVCVSDFGLSRNVLSESAVVTGANVTLGTEGYAAPEQWQDAASVDFRADIFALGGLLFIMTVGRAPLYFDLDDVPLKYRRVVERCHKHSADQRYASATLLREDFDRIWATFNPQSINTSELIEAINHLDQYSPETTRGVIERYQSASVDWSIVRDTLSAWSQDAIEIAYLADKHLTASIVSAIFESIPNTVDFSFLDVISLFARNSFEAASTNHDHALQATALRALVREGARFERWNLGRQFGFLADRVKTQDEQSVFEDAIERELASAEFVLKYINSNTALKAFIEARIPVPDDAYAYLDSYEQPPF